MTGRNIPGISNRLTLNSDKSGYQTGSLSDNQYLVIIQNLYCV